MDFHALLSAVFLGIIEGLTEFLPVSSTGHLLLTDYFMGVKSQSDVFEVVIQLGAILAVVAVYFERLWKAVRDFPTRAEARYFALTVLAGFLPAAVIGFALHKFIKEVLFASPALIAVTLILGGIAILFIERLPHRELVTNSEQIPLKKAIGIGFFQCLAMIPGVSRSGATICGAMLIGVERKAAAEYSFFLAIPTMAAAGAYDLYKNYAQLNAHDLDMIVVGFVVSFIVALVVVRGFIGFIGRHGFTPFAWYRILAGSVVLMALGLGF
ncbi:MAG: undecaprenyl-diphosphate phosphatase [Alphaproteobacteria bacterium]